MASRKLRFWFVTLSVAAHAGTAAAVFVAGIWDIDRLDRDTRPVAVLTMNLPAPAPAGGEVSLPDAKIVPKPRRIADDLTQITKKPPINLATTTGNPGLDKGPGTGDGPPDSIGTCTIPPCGLAPIPDPPKPPPDPPKPIVDEGPVIVTPDVLKIQRKSGETQIQAPEAVKVEMRHDNRNTVTAVVYVCADEGGALTRVTLKKSTKYPAYDERILKSVRAWRFHPYVTKGRNVKICGTTTFVYTMM